MSRPMRARGLKQFIEVIAERIEMVAPHAGAWVETSLGILHFRPSTSRPMRARGLKLHCSYLRQTLLSRAPCGRVG